MAVVARQPVLPGSWISAPVVGSRLKIAMPPSLLAEHARRLSDGEIWQVITRGQGAMASYAAQVLHEDRWRVIQHVRTLQTSTSTFTPSSTPTSTRATATGGTP